jgi:hypothetical protein
VPHWHHTILWFRGGSDACDATFTPPLRGSKKNSRFFPVCHLRSVNNEVIRDLVSTTRAASRCKMRIVAR